MAKHPNLRCAEMLELEGNGHCSICFKNAYILKGFGSIDLKEN